MDQRANSGEAHGKTEGRRPVAARRQDDAPATSSEPARHGWRPFLKWAGGKRQLLPTLRRFYPQRFETYHEPFLGGGAVFFDLVSRGAGRKGRVRLSDANADLIGCLRELRDDREAVIGHLQELSAQRSKEPVEHYYRVRERFNRGRAEKLKSNGPTREPYTAELAAMLIYLNRTGFNGLFRVNSNGGFNVPAGSYKNPTVCDAPNLRRAAEALSALDTTMECTGYEAVLENAEPHDFVYLDPPYAPLSATAAFTSYTADGFDETDQRRLQKVVIELAERGCHVVLSNSTAREIAALYEDHPKAQAAGIRTHRVRARRAINSKGTGRAAIEEYVITNVTPTRE